VSANIQHIAYISADVTRRLAIATASNPFTKVARGFIGGDKNSAGNQGVSRVCRVMAKFAF
jgi:hypothetical protein